MSHYRILLVYFMALGLFIAGCDPMLVYNSKYDFYLFSYKQDGMAIFIYAQTQEDKEKGIIRISRRALHRDIGWVSLAADKRTQPLDKIYVFKEKKCIDEIYRLSDYNEMSFSLWSTLLQQCQPAYTITADAIREIGKTVPTDNKKTCVSLTEEGLLQLIPDNTPECIDENIGATSKTTANKATAP